MSSTIGEAVNLSEFCVRIFQVIDCCDSLHGNDRRNLPILGGGRGIETIL